MINRLQIENFAIIHHLELQLESGLVILTGETGAGKSIILDAIQVLLGGAVQPVMVRTGATKARLEAVISFDTNQEDLHEILVREDLEEDPGVITLEREIRLEGRSNARINGHSVSQSILREVGSFLIDIHGQSEHLSLLNSRSHIHLLDRYARNLEQLSGYQTVFHQLTNIRKEIRELETLEKESHSKADLIAFQLNEISTAKLTLNEDDELETERNRLANAENLSNLVNDALVLLEESPAELPSISDQLGQVSRILHNLSRIDPSQDSLDIEINNVIDQLTDTTHALRIYSEEIENNPKRLLEIEERLVLINLLKKKYGGSIESTLTFARNISETMEKFSSASEQIEELRAREKTVKPLLSEKALELSQNRKDAARSLSTAIELELKDLQMAGARFETRMQTIPDSNGIPDEMGIPQQFDQYGIDQVEFMIAPNPGEGLKPLAQIASGGETSRLMLALKNVLSYADPVPTLIFDEIDQGIGGRVGMVVGHKLWQLARNHQVFCVTHLPQLAAFGDTHFHVSKEVVDGRTNTRVTLLNDGHRKQELAQMLGTVSENTLKSAQDLLDTVKEDRKN